MLQQAIPADTASTKPAPASEDLAKVKGRIKVSIHRGITTASTTIKCSHPDLLPATVVNDIGTFANLDRRYYTILDYVGYPLNDAIYRTRTTVPLQVWTDTLVSYIAGRVMLKQNDATTDASVLSKPAYLAVGDELYKLSPAGLITSNRALKVMKAQIIDKAKTDALALVEDAKQAATQIAATTKATRDTALRMMEEAKQAGKLSPPKWVTDNAVLCRYQARSAMWEIGFFINYAPKVFAFEFTRTVKDTKTPGGARTAWMRKQWNSNYLSVPPVRTLMWVPIATTGLYGVSTILVDRAFPTLPHNSHSGSCMGLSTAPGTITSFAHFTDLIGAVQTCLNESVEMHSLYAPESLAYEAISAFCPGKNATERNHFISASKGRWTNPKTQLRAGLQDYPSDEEYEIKTKGEAPPNTEFTA